MDLDRFYYLSKFLAFVQPSDAALDNMILTRHQYLLIYSPKGDYLVVTDQYLPGSFSHDYEKNTSQLKIVYNDIVYTVKDISDIIGFRDFEIALDFCDEKTDCLCTPPSNKLIFSPQLTKFLLKEHFQIVDIKEKNDGSGDVIHVFLVEDGFYKAIKKWKEQKSKNNKD